MSEQLHLDPDTLSAFVEGVLPEHDRAECLAHLAECSRCREIVFAVQDAPAAPVMIPIRRFRPIPVLAAAAAVCFALLGTWLYLRSRTQPPREQAVASITPTIEQPPEVPKPTPTVTESKPKIARRPPSLTNPPAPIPTPVVAQAAPPPPIQKPAEPRSEISVAGRAAVEPTPAPPINLTLPQLAASETPSGISGIVTDSTGAIIPKATVELRQLAGNITAGTRTDEGGNFKFTGLAPGLYELRIQMAGFRLTSQQVEVKAREIAAVNSQLQVGSTAETVDVSAMSATIQTESSSVSRSKRKVASPSQPRPLPSKLPAETTVTQGKIILSVDSAGTLFLSGNSGKSWKAIKPVWSGKITDLITPPDASDAGPAQFQLTTDADADWLSRDGRHWYPAPPEKK